jgi:hypothetical protein
VCSYHFFDSSDSLIFIERTAAIPDSQSLTSLTSIPYAALLSELYLSASDQSLALSQASKALLFTDTHIQPSSNDFNHVQPTSIDLE